MAVMSVNPTRMELTKLKKKLVTARRGHKLLKDKQDELVRQLLLINKETDELRKKVDIQLKKAKELMILASGEMSDEEIAVALMCSGQKLTVDVNEKKILNISVPVISPTYKLSKESGIYSYGFAFTAGELDEAVKIYSDISDDMLILAQREKTCYLLSKEIEATRRRVNALEYIIIADCEDTIKYISMKLDENERSITTRLMKVKDIMLEKAHSY